MNYKKTTLCSLQKSYAVADLTIHGRQTYVYASEIDEHCYAFDAQTLQLSTVWENDGGTMGIVALPDQTGFLAIQKFYPPFLAKESRLVRTVLKADGTWETDILLKLPYLHRFGLTGTLSNPLLALATVCAAKSAKDDWSSPGSLYSLPLDLAQSRSPTLIRSDLTRNHGFHCTPDEVICASDDGVFLFTPAESSDAWACQQLISAPCGEAALADINSDGKRELITLEPFHGTALRIYEQTDSGYSLAWSYPEPLEFVHALWCGLINGQISGICGARRQNAPLFRFFYSNNTYQIEMIEEGSSTANICVTERNGKSVILAANHGRNECAFYECV